MILDINGLSFGWRKQPVFNQANLQLREPGLYGLVAPNGSGKSTLLNLITNLLKPQSGTIKIMDAPNSTRQVFEQVAFLQDNSVLYPYLTGREHLIFVAQMHQLPIQAIQPVADELEMTDYLDRKTQKYSLGMKQRLLLAMALLVKRPLMLLDEPLNGLDPTSLQIVREALISTKEAGQTALISSHNLDELMRVTNDIFFIVDQHIEFYHLDAGDTAEVRYNDLYVKKR